MEKMVTVSAKRDHRNDFGKVRAKKKGDTYPVPESAVASLVAGGWIDDPAKAAQKAA